MKIKILLIAMLIGVVAMAQTPEHHVMSADPEVRELVVEGLELLKDSSVCNNRILALKLFKKAAALNDPTSQFLVGEMYEKGLGTKKDELQAFEWYLKSANNGDMHAMNKVGLAYKDGRVVPQDFSKAVQWFQRSVDVGNPIGSYFLGYMYYKGFGVEQNYNMAFELTQKSADADVVAGKHLLAYCYENARGTEINLDKAQELYDECVKRGYKQSKIRLEKVIEKKRDKEKTTTKSAEMENSISQGIPSALRGFDDYVADNKRVNMKMDGQWQGILFFYDWSKKEIEEQKVLNLSLNDQTYSVDGSWQVEAENMTQFYSLKVGNTLFFKNLKLEAEGALGAIEEWNVEEGQFDYKTVDGESYLVGDLMLYNSDIQEPFRPCNVALKLFEENDAMDTVKSEVLLSVVELNDVIRKTDEDRRVEMTIYPNPTSGNVAIDYDILEPGEVIIYVVDINGKVVQVVENSCMKEVGHYSNIASVGGSPGSYFVQLVHNDQTYSKAIIKQ